MATSSFSPLPDQSARHPRSSYRPGDLVIPVQGYPILYEIIRLESDCLVRVRGVDWPGGYTVVISVQEVRPIARILG